MELMSLDEYKRLHKIDALVALEAQTAGETANAFTGAAWQAAQFEKDLPLKGTLSLVAVEGDAARGFSVAYRRRNALHISRVIVSPLCRGKGFATALVSRQLDLARLQRLAAATVEVVTGNETAQRLYEKVGFTPLRGKPLETYITETGKDPLVYGTSDARQKVMTLIL